MQEVKVEVLVAIEEICTKAVHVLANDSWIINSGTLCRMTSPKNWYTSLQPVGDDVLVAVDNDAKCPVKGKEIVDL